MGYVYPPSTHSSYLYTRVCRGPRGAAVPALLLPRQRHGPHHATGAAGGDAAHGHGRGAGGGRAARVDHARPDAAVERCVQAWGRSMRGITARNTLHPLLLDLSIHPTTIQPRRSRPAPPSAPSAPGRTGMSSTRAGTGGCMSWTPPRAHFSTTARGSRYVRWIEMIMLDHHSSMIVYISFIQVRVAESPAVWPGQARALLRNAHNNHLCALNFDLFTRQHRFRDYTCVRAFVTLAM